MNLFETLASILGENADITIVVRKADDDKLIVCTNYKNNSVNDAARNIIAPLVVTGSPAELDAEFVSVISEPIKQSAGLQTSMANFEASKKAAEAKSQAASQKKKKAEDTKKANKKKFDSLMADAKKLADAKKFTEAKKLYKEALAIADGADKAKASSGVDFCEKNEQPDIFSFGQAEPTETPTATEPADEADENPDNEEASGEAEKDLSLEEQTDEESE